MQMNYEQIVTFTDFDSGKRYFDKLLNDENPKSLSLRVGCQMEVHQVLVEVWKCLREEGIAMV